MISGQPWWFFALLSAFFAALTTLFAEVGVMEVDSTLATTIRTAVILAIAWIWVGVGGQWREIPALAPRAIGFLVLSGAATGLSCLCYFRALQLGNASLVASEVRF
jgi:bacterial/archaeal transporter family protein